MYRPIASGFRRLIGAAALLLAAGAAAQSSAPGRTLFLNARVFDGKATGLSEPSSVLVDGNRIAKIARGPISPPAGATVVDPGGRTLMPGLIDAHVHLMMGDLSQLAAPVSDVGFVNLVAARGAERMLMQGFTTVRDGGGPAFGQKRAIDLGIVKGPRTFASGAFLSQTGGHGDFRLPNDVPREANAPLSLHERVGVTAFADGVEQVTLRAREQLRQGATQLKLMAASRRPSIRSTSPSTPSRSSAPRWWRRRTGAPT